MRERLETREACDMGVKQIIQILPPLPLNSTVFWEKKSLNPPETWLRPL